MTSLVAAPGLTRTPALVLAVSPVAVAVMVLVPAVLKVKAVKAWVPPANVRFPVVAPLSSAMTALASELVRVTLVVAVPTTFQFASTALTTTPLVIAVPAIWSEGAPVLPVLVPGAAVSPGSRICSLVTAPALTVIDGLVLGVLVGSVVSVAVTVQLPAVLLVSEKVLVPEASNALAGSTSLGSVEVIPTVSVTLLTRFQLASTALTVTL